MIVHTHCDREFLWNSIEKHNLDLFAFLKTLTSIQFTRVMAGLTQTESEETNVFLLKLTIDVEKNELTQVLWVRRV